MPTVRIRGQSIDVDIESELQAFSWTRPKWSSDKLIAASPFRYDKTPSFFVKLKGEYSGCWADSGSYDAEWASGNLVKLLGFLRNETYEETEDYLLGTYGWQDDGETVNLAPIRLRTQRDRQTLSTGYMEQFTEDYRYLLSRGISEGVQRQMGVRYDPASRAVVIPWRLPNKNTANVKFRTDYGKTFWYYRGGEPIRNLIYGIERAGPTTVLCEAEIDAMSFMEAGYRAVAIGGASFNDVKRDLILRSPIEELIIATDNDKAGGKLRTEIEQSLRGYLRLSRARLPESVKDANEALVKYGSAALRQAVEQSVDVAGMQIKLR